MNTDLQNQGQSILIRTQISNSANTLSCTHPPTALRLNSESVMVVKLYDHSH